MKAGSYLTAMRLIDFQDFLHRNAALSEPCVSLQHRNSLTMGMMVSFSHPSLAK